MGCSETMETLKMEFRCRAFSLGGTNPTLFVTPQGRWLGMPWTFMTYRMALAIYQLIFVILTLVYWGEDPFYSAVDTKAKWLIYISNWTYLFVLAYFVIAVVNAFYWHLGRQLKDNVVESGKSKDQNEMSAVNPVADAEAAAERDDRVYSTPWYLQIQRFCQVYSCSASVFVTILFWVLVYDPDTTVIHVFNVHVHGIAMTLMIIDTILVATPFRILHMVHTCQLFRIKNQNPKCDSAKYRCPCRPRTNSYAPKQGKGVVPLTIGTFFIFTCKNSIFPALFEANITMPGADLPLSQFNIIFNYFCLLLHVKNSKYRKFFGIFFSILLQYTLFGWKAHLDW